MKIQNKSGQLPRMLILGDAVVATGYARVVYEIMQPLCTDFEMHQLGVNYQGDAHNWPWKIYPAQEEGNLYGFKRLEGLLDEINPDIIFMLGDDLVLASWMKTIRNWKGRIHARVLIYCPVDTHPVLPVAVKEFSFADRLVTYTGFGRDCFIKEMKQHTGLQLLSPEVLPHGVNTNAFFPTAGSIDARLSAAGKLNAKRKLAGGKNILDDSFIVLNANRNQERKRLDITIRGFAEFAKDKPASVMLYLHCGVKDIGWNIIDLARREGIYDRLIVTTTAEGKPIVPDAELNMIYNACDVGINTSSAEGWGLVNFEHAATGAAQLIPDHSGCSELWKNHAEMLAPSLSITSTQLLREYYIISPAAVAAALERLYRDRNYLDKMSRAAFENATRPEYRWQTISEQWRALFLEELKKLPQTFQVSENVPVKNNEPAILVH